MRRSSHALGIAAPLALLAAAPAAAQVPETPNEDDVPKPVPVEVSLAGAERPDISRFLNVRSAGAPSLSPDAARLAFRTSITGTPQLWVTDARPDAPGAQGGPAWPIQLTFGESVTFHAWSPTGDWILYGTDRGGNEREGFYLVSPDGTEERELLAPSDAFRQFGSFTRDGSRIAYATTERNGRDFDIHVLDVATGEHREVFRGRMGLYAASFHPDGKAVLLTEARGEDSNDLYLFDIEAGRLDTIFSAPSPEARASFSSFQWAPDGSGFWLATDLDREFSALAFYDLESREYTWVAQPEGRNVEDVALSHDGRWLVWTENDGGWSRLRARDLEWRYHAPGPHTLAGWSSLHVLNDEDVRAGPGPLTGHDIDPPPLPRGIYSVTWAPGTTIAAFTVTGPALPGDVWTWNPHREQVRRVTESSTAGLDMDRMVVPEHLSFPARDGTTLHGLLYLPPGLEPGERPPLLLDVHGGPTGQARPGWSGVTQYLVSRGIAVFDLNYRGSTGYGKSFARANDGRLRAHEYLDMADAVAWLDEREMVDGDRAAVMGGSYGGYLTMAAVTRLPDVFDAGVAFVGVSNWVTALEGASPSLKASDRIEYGDIDDPSDRAFFETISPIAYVDGDEAPVMVLHGANDPRDPVTESDQFVRAIRELGGTVEYLRFPDEGHGIRKLSNRIIAFRRIADFLERMLGVGAHAVSQDR